VGHYGYRLFTVELHRGQGRAALDFGELRDGRHYLDEICSDVASARKITHRLGVQNESGEDAPPIEQPSGSVLRFQNAQQFGRGCVRLWMYHGPIGDGLLIDPEGYEQDTKIDGKALSHTYRAALVVPDHGLYGILGVEVNGRTCPYRHIIACLKEISVARWRLKVIENVADLAAVRAFIRESSVREVQVIKHGFARDGVHNDREIKLQVNVSGDHEIQVLLRERLLVWARSTPIIGRIFQTDDHSAREEANSLAAMAIGHPIDLDFDDSLVQIVHPSGRSRRLRPVSDFGRFVYDLGDFYPPDERFFGEVESTARDLLPA
jgi:hypothetical protein